MSLGFIPLAFGLGVIGAVTPCAFAVNALLLGYLRGKPRVERIASAVRFAGVRALFLSLVGLLFALAVDRVGLATVRYQQAIDVLLIVLGIVFIVGHYRPLPLPNVDLGSRLGRGHGTTIGLGLLFGLDIPACASPLFFAVLSRTALKGDIPGGILALQAFGLGMSAPAVMATASDWFNTVAARLARQRRTAFIWIGAMILIAAGLIELLPQTMTPIMTAADQIARRAMGGLSRLDGWRHDCAGRAAYLAMVLGAGATATNQECRGELPTVRPIPWPCSTLLVTVLVAGCSSGQSSPALAPVASAPRIELVSMSPDPPKVGLLDVTVRVLGADGQAIDNEIERVRIVPEMVGMPTHTVERTFKAQGNGVYTGQAEVSALGGAWQLRVIAELKNGEEIEQTFEITVQY